MPTNDWYQTFFDDEYLRLFAPFLTEERTRQEVDFVAATLDLAAGSSILDLACGQGRLLLPLAERGYRMVGLDLSPALLARARREAAARRLPVHLVRADMRSIPLHGAVDAVISVFSALGYFETDVEDQAVFDGIAGALRPGGAFLLDVANPLATFRHYAEKDWLETPAGVRVLIARAYDWRSGRNREDWRIIRRDGTEEQRWFRVRIYTLPELTTMLAMAGLAIGAVFGGAQGERYGFDSPRLIVVGKKR